MKKRHRELEKLLPDGWRIQVDGKSHLRVVRADGEPARAPDGRALTFASSPGDGRSHANMLAQLRRAGVIS